MSESYTLEAQARTVIGKQVKSLRRQNLIPAIIYGAGIKPISVSCPRRPLEIVLQKAGSTNLVTVSIDGKSHNTLVREVQRDKVRRDILHVDFLEVDLTKKLRTEVQVMLVNQPKLGADLMLSHNLLAVEVECLPTNIPSHIEVNVSGLTTAGAKITLAELPPLPNVEILGDPHEIVARIESLAPAPEEEEEVPTETTAAAEPEVVQKGKKEEEEF